MKIACITPDRKHDYLVSGVLEGFEDLGATLVVSDPGNGATDKKMSDVDFVTAANECDFLLVFFGKVRGNLSPRYYLVDRIKLPRCKKAYVDGSEWTFTGWENVGQAAASLVDPTQRRGEPWINASMLSKCGHYFKRECYPQDLQHGILSLPFALCKKHVILPKNKDVDIFCSFGHVKTGLRKDIQEACKSIRKESLLNVVVKSGMSRDEYNDTLARSRVIVDAWGGGDTTDRFWEGIGAGACVLYQRHNVFTPNQFVDWKHAVSYTTITEMTSSINRLFFGRSDELDNIAHAGLEHAMYYHTAKERAKFIIDTVLA